MKTINHTTNKIQAQANFTAEHNNLVNLEIIIAFALLLLPFVLLIDRL